MNYNTMSVGDAIRAFLKRYKLEDKYHEERVAIVCREVIGEDLARWIRSISFHRGNLNIEVNNAAVKQELGFHRSTIKESVNKYFNREMVHQVNIHS
jgi:hypothetical protein